MNDNNMSATINDRRQPANLPIKYNSYLVGIVCRESGNSNTEYGQCLYSYTLSAINIMGRNGHSHLLVIGI